MQISASLQSYENAPRAPIYDRRTLTTEESDDPVINRRDDAITGSQTVLSSSLAEALWSIQRRGEDDISTSNAVERLYMSYAE